MYFNCLKTFRVVKVKIRFRNFSYHHRWRKFTQRQGTRLIVAIWFESSLLHLVTRFTSERYSRLHIFVKFETILVNRIKYRPDTENNPLSRHDTKTLWKIINSGDFEFTSSDAKDNFSKCLSQKLSDEKNGPRFVSIVLFQTLTVITGSGTGTIMA